MELQNFYKEGLSWLISSHEIVYLKPAYYAETVNIQTTLRHVADDHLVAEMVMTNEQNTHIKAVIWTKFIPVNIKTGKRASHPPAVIELVSQLENKEAGAVNTIQERISIIMAGLARSND